MSVGFICPSCGGFTEVKDSRPRDSGAGIRRRRRCTSCSVRFTTLEVRSEDVSAVFGGTDTLNPRELQDAASLVTSFTKISPQDRLLLLGLARRLRGEETVTGPLRAQLAQERRADA